MTQAPQPKDNNQRQTEIQSKEVHTTVEIALIRCKCLSGHGAAGIGLQLPTPPGPEIHISMKQTPKGRKGWNQKANRQKNKVKQLLLGDDPVEEGKLIRNTGLCGIIWDSIV